MVNGGKGIRRLARRIRLDNALERIRLARAEVKQIPGKVKRIMDFVTDPKQNSVIPSLIIFYILCIINGWYNTFVAVVPTQVLEDSLTVGWYRVFVWVTFMAPIFTLGGMCLTGELAFTGAVMQLAGNIGVSGVIWTFVAAVWYTTWWGQGNFGTT